MEKPSIIEECDNCGEKIGKLEKPYVWQDHIVCSRCYSRLTASARPTPASIRVEAHPITPEQQESSPFDLTDKRRNEKAAAVMARVFFWIIAGIVILSLIGAIEYAQNARQR